MSDPYYAKGLLVSLDGTPMKTSLTSDLDLNINVQNLIRNYQQRGHLVTNLDPLGIIDHPKHTSWGGVSRRANESVTQLVNFKDSDMDKEVQLPATTWIGGKKKTMKVR